MIRASYIWDRVECELVSREEYAKRQAARAKPVNTDILNKRVERGSWVYDREKRKVVKASEYWANKPRPASAPMVISDTMDPTWHPATGMMADSKAAFRKMTRQSGCVEVGNEPLKAKPRTETYATRKQRAEAIKQAYRQHGVDVL